MRTFLRRLASIMIYPRTTMRAILDEPRDRMVIPLVMLAAISAFVGDLNENARGSLKQVPFGWLIAVCAMIVALLVTLLIFWLFAWVAYVAGKFLEGQGDHSAVRSALAWGLAPFIFALVYRLPAALFGPVPGVGQVRIGDGAWRIEPGLMSGGCLQALVIGLLELTVFVWYLVVASRTLAEAHRFSPWRGLGTLVIVAATPVIVTIAAVLAMH